MWSRPIPTTLCEVRHFYFDLQIRKLRHILGKRSAKSPELASGRDTSLAFFSAFQMILLKLSRVARVHTKVMTPSYTAEVVVKKATKLTVFQWNITQP